MLLLRSRILFQVQGMIALLSHNQQRINRSLLLTQRQQQQHPHQIVEESIFLPDVHPIIPIPLHLEEIASTFPLWIKPCNGLTIVVRLLRLLLHPNDPVIQHRRRLLALHSNNPWICPLMPELPCTNIYDTLPSTALMLTVLFRRCDPREPKTRLINSGSDWWTAMTFHTSL